MIRAVAICVLLLLGLAPASRSAAEEPAAELPGWMAGCWQEVAGDDWTEECWTTPRAGVMLGSSRSGRGEQARDWEFMRIVRDAPNGDGPAVRMALLAAPQGRGWTMFAWSPGGEPGVTFLNAEHDYPQRIRYWREGALLKAEISRRDGSGVRGWTYRPMKR